MRLVQAFLSSTNFLPANFRRMLTRKSLAILRLACGLSSAESGHSGRSIQFLIRSANCCPREPTVACYALWLTKTWSSLLGRWPQTTSSAPDMRLMWIWVGFGWCAHTRTMKTRTFLVRLNTTPSSCHDASEYPESKSRLFTLLGEPWGRRPTPASSSSSSSSGLARQQAES